MRLGEVSIRYQAPTSQAIEQLLTAPTRVLDRSPQDEGDDEPAAELLPGIRVFFAAHPAPVEPGAATGLATLTVQNRGQVVD